MSHDTDPTGNVPAEDVQAVYERFYLLLQAYMITHRRFSVAWWRKDTQEEDDVLLHANELILDTVLDADMVSKIELHTGKNVREQLTQADIDDLRQKIDLLRMGKLRN